MNAKIDIAVFWRLIAPTHREVILYLSGLPRVQWADVAHCEWQHMRPNIQSAILKVLAGCTEVSQ